jgi:FAD/FMN-containing dehydrogenase
MFISPLSSTCMPIASVTGYSQGGGVGPTARHFGMAADNVLAFEVAMANGTRIVRAAADENADLYWALRGGGGGNFGVVTAVTFRVFAGPPLYTFARLCFADDAATRHAVLTVIGARNAELARVLNVDWTIDGDGVCAWIVFQGARADLKRAIAPLFEDARMPALTAQNVTEARDQMMASKYAFI